MTSPGAEDRLHGDAVVHEHHRAGFGDGRFLRVELYLDELHFAAVDLVVDFVHLVHGVSCVGIRRDKTRPATGVNPRDSRRVSGIGNDLHHVGRVQSFSPCCGSSGLEQL